MNYGISCFNEFGLLEWILAWGDGLVKGGWIGVGIGEILGFGFGLKSLII